MVRSIKSAKKLTIRVVIPTCKNIEAIQKIGENIKNTCDNSCPVQFYQNEQGIGLTRIYNSALNNEVLKTNEDIIVFMHDDVEILKKGWDSELIRMFEEHKEYGIIGVAGSAEFDEQGAWWNYSKKYGQVMHRHGGRQWLSSFSPLLDKDLEEVCVIDGLFMAVHRKRITKMFDEDIKGFNFYDIDFCLANYLDRRCKIGVTSHIRLCHNSIGSLKNEWFENLKQVNEKYKNDYPITVKKYGK